MVRLRLAICWFLVLPAGSLAGDLAQFRGPDGTGVLPDQPIVTDWSSDKHLKWKVPNPGAGWSQPIVWRDRIYVSGAVSESDLRPANFADGVKSPQSMGLSLFTKAPDVVIEWKLFCLNAEDGRPVWEQTIASGKPKFPIHPSNSWATETPIADDGGVCVLFGAAGMLARVNHDGSVVWSKDLGVFKTSNSFGTGSSLAAFEDRLFVQSFHEEGASVLCLSCGTGEELWKMVRENPTTSWSTPLVWKHQTGAELIVSGGDQVDSFDPMTGESLWTLRNVKAATACSACADQRHLYFGGSDPFSKGALVAVKSGARGDLTPAEKNQRFESCAWMQDRQGPGMASPVSSGKFVYVVDRNILKCFDAESGERLYQSRLPGLDLVAASPLLVGDKLLIIDENGKVCIVAAEGEFRVIGSGELADTFWATPAVSAGAVYLRGLDFLYCVRNE